MEKTFERIAEHFYKRQYQSAEGQWKTIFYARFVDWQGKRRMFPLGDHLADARDKLGELRTLNKGRYDFAKEKKERVKAKIKGMTLAEWLDRYLDLVKHMASSATKSSQCIHLKRLLARVYRVSGKESSGLLGVRRFMAVSLYDLRTASNA